MQNVPEIPIGHPRRFLNEPTVPTPLGVGASFVNTVVPYFCELMNSDGTWKPSTMVRRAAFAVPAELFINNYIPPGPLIIEVYSWVITISYGIINIMCARIARTTTCIQE